MSGKSEILDVVNDNDKKVGTATKERVYKEKLPHRVVHVLLLRPDFQEVFLQIRSLKKSYLPGYYCTSAGGHVQAGETYVQAARRELYEELGITSRLRLVYRFLYTDNNHKRYISVFIAITDKKEVSFLDGEVMEGKFMSLPKAASLIRKGSKIHPQLKECFTRLLKRGFSR